MSFWSSRHVLHAGDLLPDAISLVGVANKRDEAENEDTDD
jgi:hypothetical protein